ncbi:MAG TPA: acyl-CoA dehydrogenase family protein [Polyangiales bacterium]|nr:acyl-CoA dehydrogenase family protein [Polyangiales bacterium]
MSDHYHPNSEQVAFANSIGKSLISILPLSRLQKEHEEGARAWSALSELGVFAISTPEHEGGSGLGATEEALIVFELGRRVVAPSVLSTIAATHLQAAAKRVQSAASPRVAAGYRRGGQVVYVEDSSADLLLVRAASSVTLFELPGASRLVDSQLWSSRLLEVDQPGRALAEASAPEVLRLRLIDAAALAGIARAALEMAVEYARQREQFGRPIGSFQAVKHQCADMALAARCAADQVAFAAVAVDDERDDAVLQVESAFWVAGSAALANGGKNIQIHGGIGFSDEAQPHHLLKRARVLIEIAGGLPAALTRIEHCP